MISVKIAYSAYIASRINQSMFLKQNKKPKFVKLHLKKEKFGITKSENGISFRLYSSIIPDEPLSPLANL